MNKITNLNKKNIIILIGTLLIGIVIITFLINMTLSAEISEKPQEFKVTFEIMYNGISLQEASRLEKLIKSDYSDACIVNIQVENAEMSITDEWNYSITDTSGTTSVYDDYFPSKVYIEGGYCDTVFYGNEQIYP